MTLDEYKKKLRQYRGHLKSVTTEIEAIYIYGCEELRNYSLHSKLIGVKKMATIAGMTHAKQKEFIEWVQEAPRFKADIDLKLTELL